MKALQKRRLKNILNTEITKFCMTRNRFHNEISNKYIEQYYLSFHNEFARESP
jgi:predicted ribosome quality control (RQC) complex YloA/Tae2 family protein